MNYQAVLSTLQQKIGSADWSQWLVLRWQFYDYVRYTNATTQLNFFQNALGAVDPVSTLAKTTEQTNMPKTGTFGQVYFVIQQIRTHVSILPKVRQPAGIANDTTWTTGILGDAASNVLALFRRGVLNFSILQKQYMDIERPFLAAPPGFGLRCYERGCSRATAPSILAQQSIFTRDVFNMTPPQLVEPEANFAVNIKFDTAAPTITVNESGTVAVNVDVGVIFDGYLARPAQ